MEKSSKIIFPIVLVGFMGAGKTVVGWLVARALGVKFVDLDREIERRAGFPLNEIFNISGEGRFRDLETEALNELLQAGKRSVIASGGGVVVSGKNRSALKGGVTCVFLDPPFPFLLSRIRLSGSHLHDLESVPPSPEAVNSSGSGRPLADGATDRELEDLWKSRHPWYEEVAKCLISRTGTIEEIAGEVLNRLSQ